MRARAWVSVSSILALGFETLLLEALLASCPAWAEPADSQPLPPVTITAPTPPPAQTPVSRREPAPAPRAVGRRPAPASRTVQTGPAVASTQPAIPAEITRSDLSPAAAALPAA